MNYKDLTKEEKAAFDSIESNFLETNIPIGSFVVVLGTLLNKYTIVMFQRNKRRLR